jgi:hypothetical protein
MAKLILSMDGLVLKEIPLNKERLTIGRKPHNDIQIDNLAISGEHAVVVTILADSFLEDLNSTNGTLVNGQPIKKHFLRNNDVIELGKYKMKYMADLQAGAAASDFEKNCGDPLRFAAHAVGTATGTAETPDAFERRRRFPAQAADAGMMARRPVAQRSECRQGAGPDQNADHAGQAGPAGGRDCPPAAWLLHHPCRRRAVSPGQWQVPRRPGLSSGDHDVIEIAGIKMAFFLKGP